MENYSYSSYPDSGDSSPRSREIDCENASWDEPPATYRVKFMCSYGGKIHPRPHDNQLAYIGGETKILAVDRHVKLPALLAKLASLCDAADICFKYQLPGEDLDALISVTNDEDLEHMMLEYDRLHRTSSKPARLRLFIFPLNLPPPAPIEPKSERQWFVEALNSVQPPPPPSSAAATATTNPDYLFGLDKAPPGKLQDPAPTAPELVQKDASAGSDCGSEPLASPTELQRQIQELQRLQISGGHFQRKFDEGNPRAFGEEYYGQGLTEKIAPQRSASPAPTALPVPMQIPASYMAERHGNYPAGTEQQPVYLFPAGASVYPGQGIRPVAAPASQAYYGVQGLVRDAYREQPVYNAAPIQQQAPQKLSAFSEGVGIMQQKVGVPEPGFVQVGYDSAGRQVFYTTTAGVTPPYQAVAMPAATVDSWQGGGGADGKVVGKAS